MTEPEAELQATANLSPVSPSPLHTAAPRMVPALQDTADTLDAMVAAAANVVSSDGGVVDAIFDPNMMAEAASVNGNDHVVEDDSLDGAYDDQDATDAPTESAPQPQPEPLDSNDDYAKTFDSPIDPEEGDEQGFQQQHHVSSSSMPPKPNDISLQSDHLNASRASDAVPDNVALDASTAQPAAPAGTPSGAQPEPTGPSTEPWHPPVGPQQQTGFPFVAQPEPVANQDSADTESQDSSVDIQKPVADLTAQPIEPSSDAEPSSSIAAYAEQPAGSASLSSPTSLPASSSLPPRPPLPQSGSQSYASQQHAAGPNPNAAASSAGAVLPASGPPSGFVADGAPGTSTEAISSLPLPPAAGLNALPVAASMNAPHQMSQAAPEYSQDGEPDANYQRQWDQFMSDERQYMSDAKWDRFPEGSRIFIGNLSSDKVSKRDVFDVFHKYGRLAQISLKSAYGFVQYHAVDEGRQAMENLQGIEIKGRRIHLEISRVQEMSKNDRARSPERGRGRDGGGRRNEKRHQGRDDYRPGRNHSPRRNDHHAREDGFGRSRGHDSGRGGRGRSRSPEYGRKDRDSHRRRSPSPYGRSRHEPKLDLPRRYGADVSDVQIILQPEVNRDFVTWVEAAFKAKGLKTEVMYLHPRVPKDQVIQRQAAEGVYGVIDLDLRTQSVGRIPVQVFDRSGRGSNVRFDQYVDLDPGTAAEVIVRAKATVAENYGQGYAAAVGGYSNPYAAQHPQPPHSASYPGSYLPQQQQQHAPPVAAEIASLMGQVDNATLQRLLASMQWPSQTPGGMPAAPGGYGVNPAAPAAANPQMDIQAIPGGLGGTAPALQHAHHQGQYGSAYGAQPPTAHYGGVSAPPAGGDAAAQVQNIMAQLARYRQ